MPPASPQPVKPAAKTEVKVSDKAEGKTEGKTEALRRFCMPRMIDTSDVIGLQGRLNEKDYIGAIKHASRLVNEVMDPPKRPFGRRMPGGVLIGQEATLAVSAVEGLKRAVDSLEGTEEELSPTTLTNIDEGMTKAFSFATLIMILKVVLSIIDQFQKGEV